MPRGFGILPLEKCDQCSPWWAAPILATGWEPPNHLCTTIVCIVRSVERDLETQIVVVTSNDGLRDRLQQERDALFKYGTPVTAQVQKATLCAFYLNLTSDLGRTREGCTLVGRQGSWDCQELFLVYIYLSVIDYS